MEDVAASVAGASVSLTISRMTIPARAATSMKLFSERKLARTKILRISPPTLKTKSLIVGTPSAHVSVVLGHYAWDERKRSLTVENMTKWLLASAACGLLSLASAHAVTVGPLGMSYTSDSQYLIGTVLPGDNTQNGQVARDVAMTNQLLSMSNAVNNQTSLNNSLYSRTTWPGGPSATATGAVAFDQAAIQGNATIGGNSVLLSGGFVNLTLGGTFQYLVVAYDGDHAGLAVYDISSFHAGDTIQLYAFAHPDSAHPGDLLGGTSGQYFMTSFTLLNPLGVPDGGATVMLLGAGLGALGIVRRYLTR